MCVFHNFLMCSLKNNVSAAQILKGTENTDASAVQAPVLVARAPVSVAQALDSVDRPLALPHRHLALPHRHLVSAAQTAASAAQTAVSAAHTPVSAAQTLHPVVRRCSLKKLFHKVVSGGTYTLHSLTLFSFFSVHVYARIHTRL